jgi:hypothetical protein
VKQVSTLPPSLLYDNSDEVDAEDQLTNDPSSRPAHYTARMAFLAQVRDFILFRQQDALDRAAEKVVSLISTDISPVSLRAVLLAESIQSLEGKPNSHFQTKADISYRCRGVLSQYIRNHASVGRCHG